MGRSETGWSAAPTGGIRSECSLNKSDPPCKVNLGYFYPDEQVRAAIEIVHVSHSKRKIHLNHYVNEKREQMARLMLNAPDEGNDAGFWNAASALMHLLRTLLSRMEAVAISDKT